MSSTWYTLVNDLNKIKTNLRLEIKKFNSDNQLCYYDSIILKDEESFELISKLFTKAGFKVNLIRTEYTGIYDPARTAELIYLYPTDEELLRRELRYKKL